MVEWVMILLVAVGFGRMVPGNNEKEYVLPEVPVLAVKVKVLPGQTELVGAPALLLVVRENVRFVAILRALMITVLVPWQPELST